LIEELQRRIGVIVTSGDDTCALGADGVSDIVTITADRVKPNTGKSATATAAMSALLVLDERTVVPLLNWKSFLDGGAPAAIAADA
jgi:chemotaxis signal transduction protein